MMHGIEIVSLYLAQQQIVKGFNSVGSSVRTGIVVQQHNAF
jgi:hypothetical protein